MFVVSVVIVILNEQRKQDDGEKGTSKAKKAKEGNVSLLLDDGTINFSALQGRSTEDQVTNSFFQYVDML